jgi:hypothetical protein
MKKRLIRKALSIVVGLFLFNLLAYQFYWYASIFWYDMVMHTAGGVFLALLLGSHFHKQLYKMTMKESIVVLLLGVFIIGLGWEYFEYIVQVIVKPVSFADFADSISDVICDMIGGIIGTYFVIHAKKRYNKEHATKQNA